MISLPHKLYLEPRESETLQLLLCVPDKPVQGPSHSLIPLAILAVRSIKYKDQADWKIAEVGTAHENGCEFWALGVTIPVGCPVEPPTVPIVLGMYTCYIQCSHLMSIPRRRPLTPPLFAKNPSIAMWCSVMDSATKSRSWEESG